MTCPMITPTTHPPHDEEMTLTSFFPKAAQLSKKTPYQLPTSTEASSLSLLALVLKPIPMVSILDRVPDALVDLIFSSSSFTYGLVLVLSVVPVCSLLFLCVFNYRKTSSKSSAPNGIKSYPIIRNLPQFIRNRNRLLDWSTEILAASPTNTVEFGRLGRRGIMTSNPSNIEYILKKNFANYPKGPFLTSTLEDFLGRGIFNSDGEQWRVQRKTASFEFNTRSLRNFVVVTVKEEIVSRLLPLLNKAVDTNAVVDLQDVLESFAFDNVCRIAFDVDPKCLAGVNEADDGDRLASGFAQAFRDAANLSAERFRYVIPGFWMIKKKLGIGSEKRLGESISTIHNFAMDIIRSRKKEIAETTTTSTTDRGDLLSRFIAIDDSSEEYLRDMVISFILAGRDTTSSSLSWFFWLLSSRPDVETKILEEIRSIRTSNPRLGETFGYDELKDMPYLHASISESMRIYPAVTTASGLCLSDDVLPDGTVVKKGWFVSYNSYVLGRMESIWGRDCLEYKPERWVDEKGAFQPVSPFKYPVFHGGPRMCLGKEMAYIQMKSIVVSVLERFEIDVVKDKLPEKMMSLTIRMKNGLPVRLRKRCVT